MRAAGAVLKEHSIARAPSPQRRFRLLDAMILVAATAIGFAVLQLVSRATRSSPDELWEELISPAPFDDLMTYCGKIDTLAQLTMPLVASLTLALIPIGLVRAAADPGDWHACRDWWHCSRRLRRWHSSGLKLPLRWWPLPYSTMRALIGKAFANGYSAIETSWRE